MNWEKLLRRPGTMLSGLAVCSGLLVDFQGAASKVSGAIPIIAAFLPLIAIGGVTFFAFWSITSVSSFLWSLRPAAKFGAYYLKIVDARQSCSHHLDYAGISPISDVCATNREIANTLARFGIQCPEVSQNHKDYVSIWFNFLSEIAPLARHNDLSAARNVCQTLMVGH